MKRTIILLVTAILLQIGCSKKINVAELNNTKWVLTEWPGKTLPSSAQATLNINADNTIGGKSFCNGYGGNSTITEDSIKFEQLIGTKMYCEGVNQAEIDFLNDMQAVNSLKMDGSKLQLLKNGVVAMVFTKQ